MAERVCPWWLGPILASPVRRRRHNPAEILGPWVKEGMTIIEPGPGMGFFTIPMAEMVGPSGRVICVDIQEQMLAGVRRRAKKRKLDGRIETRRCDENSLGIDDLAGAADFVLVFAMVHEVPDPRALFNQLSNALCAGGQMLVAEPAGHVSEADFARTLRIAEHAGLSLVGNPRIPQSLTAVLQKQGNAKSSQ